MFLIINLDILDLYDVFCFNNFKGFINMFKGSFSFIEGLNTQPNPPESITLPPFF